MEYRDRGLLLLAHDHSIQLMPPILDTLVLAEQPYNNCGCARKFQYNLLHLEYMVSLPEVEGG
jgi:hypothetical protein